MVLFSLVRTIKLFFMSILDPRSIFELYLYGQVNETTSCGVMFERLRHHSCDQKIWSLDHLIEKWRKTLDSKGYAGAVLMDLSKAFDTINHELMIAKLSAYGLDKTSLKIILSYLSNRWQRTKIGTTFLVHGRNCY